MKASNIIIDPGATSDLRVVAVQAMGTVKYLSECLGISDKYSPLTQDQLNALWYKRTTAD